ncbi:hypothetical protein [Salibacterium lacus]|uniref:Uncharacterized protein n=1 Tax=Salibacterium lacus TaxID=1898109 RepID=A0ABW5T488_9BACI
MKKRKKLMTFSMISIAVIFAGFFSFILFNPPLVKGSVGSLNNYHALVIAIGNKGFSDLHINDVSVNGNEEPSNVKVQVSNPLKGFIVKDTFNQEAEEFNIHDVENVTIKTNTSPAEQREKVNNDTTSTDDKSYGMSVVHNKEIENVTITYNYLGISFDKTLRVNE